MKKVYVTIGYNDAIEFKNLSTAWLFIDNVFHGVAFAENPEVASIGICFKEDKEVKDELPAI